MSRPNMDHLQRIGAVLEALVGYPPERAILVCEDAAFGIQLGLACGLPMATILANHRVAMQACCDHKFVDSPHCLTCGWTPEESDGRRDADVNRAVPRGSE